MGNQMIRGISGGQRKRVTTGEMTVGPMKTLFMVRAPLHSAQLVQECCRATQACDFVTIICPVLGCFWALGGHPAAGLSQLDAGKPEHSSALQDEISTGLDSSTTYLITKCIRNFVHMQDVST